jgi:hypothetical protein
MGSGLAGHYHIKPTPAAIRDAMDLFPKYGDYQEARRHALKLRFWPTGEDRDSGQIEDMDWCWIRSLRGNKVGELRIHDTIAGHDNLRAIFYVSDVVLRGEPLPKIWIISVMQKKSMDFTTNDITTFKARLAILKKRVYGNLS